MILSRVWPSQQRPSLEYQLPRPSGPRYRRVSIMRAATSGVSRQAAESRIRTAPTIPHMLLLSGRLGGDRDGLGGGGAFVLADPAAGAALLDFDFAVYQEQGFRADGALVHADGAVFAVGAEAEGFVPDGDAHVDVFDQRRLEGAAGAGVHAVEARAQDAGHFVGFDVGDAFALVAGVVDLDALGGADLDAFAGSAALLAEALFFERAWRPKPVADGPGGLVRLFQLAQFLGDAVDGVEGVGERAEQFAQALAKESAAVQGSFVGHKWGRPLG